MLWFLGVFAFFIHSLSTGRSFFEVFMLLIKKKKNRLSLSLYYNIIHNLPEAEWRLEAAAADVGGGVGKSSRATAVATGGA